MNNYHNLKDLEPKFEYDSKQKRRRKKILKVFVIIASVITLFILITIRCLAVSNCVKTHKGYYSNDNCAGDTCCHSVTFE